MKANLISLTIGLLLKVLNPELILGMCDAILDFIEEKVVGTANTIDDSVIIPLCEMLRATFSIPDEDLKTSAIKDMLGNILTEFTPGLIVPFLDSILDYIEEKVLGSESVIDDMLVLPVCNMIRSVGNIPDNDEEKE